MVLLPAGSVRRGPPPAPSQATTGLTPVPSSYRPPANSVAPSADQATVHRSPLSMPAVSGAGSGVERAAVEEPHLGRVVEADRQPRAVRAEGEAEGLAAAGGDRRPERRPSAS